MQPKNRRLEDAEDGGEDKRPRIRSSPSNPGPSIRHPPALQYSQMVAQPFQQSHQQPLGHQHVFSPGQYPGLPRHPSAHQQSSLPNLPANVHAPRIFLSSPVPDSPAATIQDSLPHWWPKLPSQSQNAPKPPSQPSLFGGRGGSSLFGPPTLTAQSSQSGLFGQASSTASANSLFGQPHTYTSGFSQATLGNRFGGNDGTSSMFYSGTAGAGNQAKRTWFADPSDRPLHLITEFDDSRPPSEKIKIPPIKPFPPPAPPLDIFNFGDPKPLRERDFSNIPDCLSAYGDILRQISCPGCQKPLFEKPKDIVQHKNSHTGPKQNHPFVSCGTCQSMVCVGCLSTFEWTAFVEKPPAHWTEHVLDCDGGWLFVFWLLLCGDLYSLKQFEVKLGANNKPVLATKQTQQKKTKQPSGAGVGYSSDRSPDYYGAYNHGTIGPGGEFITTAASLSNTPWLNPEDSSDSDVWDFDSAPGTSQTPGAMHRGFRAHDPLQQGMTMKRAELERKDMYVQTYVTALNLILSYTGQCPPLLLQMFSRSPLMQDVGEMLKNDSIEDISSRAEAYRIVFGLIARLEKNTDLAPLVYGERHGLQHHQDVFHATFYPKREHIPRRHVPSPPLSTFLQVLVKPAEQMQNLAKANEHFFPAHEMVNCLHMCQAICQLAKNTPRRPGDADNQDAEPDVTMTNAGAPEGQKAGELSAWHKKHAVAEVDDRLLYELHSMGEEARKMEQMRVAPGRMRRLMNEITTLSTSLPEGIYIRHGATRLDVMKVMITGPRDTPYENGLFEFDLLCPDQYPQVPPKMKFKTVGGGVGFNPNLYADGKVCLSLLGTWAGEAWRPSTSTILQVLVSIQSMIFCQDPYYNEPGRKRGKDQTLARDYNRSIQGSTIKIAIKGWLTQGQHVIWGEVMDRHFRASADAIIATAEAWAKSEVKKRPDRLMPPGPTWNVEEVRQALKDYLGRQKQIPMPKGWAA